MGVMMGMAVPCTTRTKHGCTAYTANHGSVAFDCLIVENIIQAFLNYISGATFSFWAVAMA